MKQTAVEWLENQIKNSWYYFKLMEEINSRSTIAQHNVFDQAKEMEKEQMLDFGDFIIDELEPMAQNREWVEERYNYFKSE